MAEIVSVGWTEMVYDAGGLDDLKRIEIEAVLHRGSFVRRSDYESELGNVPDDEAVVCCFFRSGGAGSSI